MSGKRIILSVSNNLEGDQRVNKVATSLHQHGYNVTVVGTQSRPCHTYTRPYKTERMPAIFKKGFLFYGELNIRLFWRLLFAKCDLMIANDTDTIAANFLASVIRRKPMTADLHELFPEVPEVVNRPFVKRFWTKIEDLILPHLKHGYTVCASIAEHYRKRYGIHLGVVRNIPPKKNYEGKNNRLDFGERKIVLYQGAVNVGRGIEWIIEAMPLVENAVFVVIGNGDIKAEMEQKCKELGVTDRIFFLGHVPFDELSDYTRSADLGVCLLKKQGLSYYYSLPNRVFDYMQQHVPLLATDFPEIAKILRTYGTGELVTHYEPAFLAETIQRMLSTPIDHGVFEKACQQFNWENEEQTLLSIVEKALN